MGHEGSTAEHPFPRLAVSPPARRRLPIPVVVRVILLVAWVAFTANSFTEAREASLDDLQRDLIDGRVSAIEVERADPGDQVVGMFALRWDAGLIDSFTRYDYHPAAGVDEAAPLLEQARASGVRVQVVSVSAYPFDGAVTKEGWLVTTFGGWTAMIGLLAIGASMVVLITSPPPWLATKWAWFWLVWAIPALWLAFLFLEPRPLVLSARLGLAGRAPRSLVGGRERRLTGGWALVIAWVASAVLAGTGVPVLSGWH